MIRSIRRAHRAWALLQLVGGLAILAVASSRRAAPIRPTSLPPVAAGTEAGR